MQKASMSLPEKDYRTTYRMRRTLIILTLAVGIILTVAGATRPLQDPSSIILLTFGVTFTASGVVSFIMLSAALLDLAENAKDLASIVGAKLGMPCAERFSLVASAAEVGLAKVYLSRTEALALGNFHATIEKEAKQLFIVGSSLLGILLDRRFKHVVETLMRKIEGQVEVKFMLTHPLFADFRAAQEGRDPGDIGSEVVASLRIISGLAKGSELVSAYLYRGTPTCFGILTSTSMLLNPYPYGRQAYESPCFEFDGRTPAYDLYKQAHFQTQFAGKIEKLDLAEQSITKLETSIKDFSAEVAKFEVAFKQKAVSQPPA